MQLSFQKIQKPPDAPMARMKRARTMAAAGRTLLAASLLLAAASSASAARSGTQSWTGASGSPQSDPRAFHIKYVEAVALDPQQQLVLEVGYEALGQRDSHGLVERRGARVAHLRSAERGEVKGEGS